MKIVLILCNLRVCQIGISIVLVNAISWRNDKYYSFVESIDLLTPNEWTWKNFNIIGERRKGNCGST